MLEKQVEQPVVDWAKRNGIKIKKKVFGEQLDRTFYFSGGRPFIIEFKAPGKRLTGLQQLEIEELLALGYDIEVHDDKSEAIEALRLRQEPYIRRQVVAPSIPERFRALATEQRGGRIIRRPRNRQNQYHSRRT